MIVTYRHVNTIIVDTRSQSVLSKIRKIANAHRPGLYSNFHYFWFCIFFVIFIFVILYRTSGVEACGFCPQSEYREYHALSSKYPWSQQFWRWSDYLISWKIGHKDEEQEFREDGISVWCLSGSRARGHLTLERPSTITIRATFFIVSALVA